MGKHPFFQNSVEKFVQFEKLKLLMILHPEALNQVWSSLKIFIKLTIKHLQQCLDLAQSATILNICSPTYDWSGYYGNRNIEEHIWLRTFLYISVLSINCEIRYLLIFQMASTNTCCCFFHVKSLIVFDLYHTECIMDFFGMQFTNIVFLLLSVSSSSVQMSLIFQSASSYKVFPSRCLNSCPALLIEL